jgi:hypothetical protein
MSNESKPISIWVDEAGDTLIIGYESTAPGENFLSVPLTQENILEWIKVLVRMLDNGDICDVPGEVATCTKLGEDEP